MQQTIVDLIKSFWNCYCCFLDCQESRETLVMLLSLQKKVSFVQVSHKSTFAFQLGPIWFYGFSVGGFGFEEPKLL